MCLILYNDYENDFNTIILEEYMKGFNHQQGVQPERRQYFGIRKLKVGAASVTIATALFLGLGSVQTHVLAEETGATTELVQPATTSTDTPETVAPAPTEQPSVSVESVVEESVPTTQPAATNSPNAPTAESVKPEEDAAPATASEPVPAQQTKENEPSSATTETPTTSPEEAVVAQPSEATTADKAAATAAETSVATSKTADPIAENTLRMHFKTLPDGEVSSLGLWTWEDVETPSDKVGSWPNGATSLAAAKKDDYGYYLDVKLKTGARSKVGFLINNTKGDNLTGDNFVELLNQQTNEVWVGANKKVSYYEPLAESSIRINYLRSDKDYATKSLWLWGSADSSITKQQGNWPDGVNFKGVGQYGAYLDVKLADLKELGFLILDESKTGDAVKVQPKDYVFKDLKNHTQLFVRDDDPTIYTNPYYVNNVRITGAQQVSPTTIEASFTTLSDTDKETILKNLTVTSKDKTVQPITDVTVDEKGNKVTITGQFDQASGPFTVTYQKDAVQARANWQYKDSLYAYDGELGARVKEAGAKVDMTLWSPSADAVSVVLYDKQDQTKVVGKVAMTKGTKGEWTTTLSATTALNIPDFRGYYYHYEITRGDQSVLVLDPYAKSLAAWNSSLADKGPSYKVAKAAIVDVAAIGEQNLGFANIKGFTKREDAVIYEAHVRDFTSDEAISAELNNQFGTFASFVERLDYLKDLGITHVQLLPVMSYYFVNELANKERLSTYSSSNTNYNWGYDPQNYFALTGMYSTDPTDPAKRIEEFKNLVNEIHKRGMGVMLDVVYNHTANVDIFENLEPNYYHFMDADGTPRTSFGGGRLGTTHYMSRRVLVDSIKYLVENYKVDGFRFDMMGDHDAAVIEKAFNEAKAINPKVIMLGEGWVTYQGDENMPEQPADQSWMSKTDTVASFSDDIRNTLKSGYPNEGSPAFITGGARDVLSVFKNIKAQPTNFTADDPGDVIQYIAAHDNLTLFDIIAQSIKKDPALAANNAEIHRRLRLGNLLVLTAQGTPFIHSGQEYGRTKQFRDPAYKGKVADDKVPNKSHFLTNEDGTPFEYPYFIHDSYDSTDAINHFDWTKATNAERYPENTRSQAYTKGLIALRRSTDAFRLGSKDAVDASVTLITVPGENGVAEKDLVIGYQVTASNGDIYAVLVNADAKSRTIALGDAFKALLKGEVLADGKEAGITAISNPEGVHFTADGITLDALTATIIRMAKVAPAPADQNGKSAKPAPAPNVPEDKDEVKNVTNLSTGKADDTAAPKAQAESVQPTKQEQSLPSTGDKSSTALTALGVATLLAGIELVKKRQDD